jgi:hypothetical protein
MNSIRCPFAYCELGFIDNVTDRARWDTPDKQRAFAAAYAKAMLRYLGITWIDEAPAQPAAPNKTSPPIKLYVIAGEYDDARDASARLVEIRQLGVKGATVRGMPQFK